MRQVKHKNRVAFYPQSYSACFSLEARLTQVWDQVSLLSSLMSPFLISKYRHKEVIAIGREIKDTCHLLSGHKTICVKLLPSNITQPAVSSMSTPLSHFIRVCHCATETMISRVFFSRRVMLPIPSLPTVYFTDYFISFLIGLYVRQRYVEYWYHLSVGRVCSAFKSMSCYCLLFIIENFVFCRPLSRHKTFVLIQERKAIEFEATDSCEYKG